MTPFGLHFHLPLPSSSFLSPLLKITTRSYIELQILSIFPYCYSKTESLQFDLWLRICLLCCIISGLCWEMSSHGPINFARSFNNLYIVLYIIKCFTIYGNWTWFFIILTSSVAKELLGPLFITLLIGLHIGERIQDIYFLVRLLPVLALLKKFQKLLYSRFNTSKELKPLASWSSCYSIILRLMEPPFHGCHRDHHEE